MQTKKIIPESRFADEKNKKIQLISIIVDKNEFRFTINTLSILLNFHHCQSRKNYNTL